MQNLENIDPGLDRGEHWDIYAACGPIAKHMPETFDDYFYPDSYEKTQATVVMAKRICGNCVVRSECLEDALAHDDTQGIKGGLTPRERRSITRIHLPLQRG